VKSTLKREVKQCVKSLRRKRIVDVPEAIGIPARRSGLPSPNQGRGGRATFRGSGATRNSRYWGIPGKGRPPHALKRGAGASFPVGVLRAD